MKNLLVGTDLSERSERAVQRALALSDELDARLVVLNVVDEEYPAAIANVMKTEAEGQIDKALGAHPALNREAVFRKVVLGTDFREILREADEGNADLIILGTHREVLLGDLFLGTTAERVVRRGNDPVLIVKKQVKGPYRRVLVAIDFSVYSRRAVEFALKFVPGGELFLVHAFDMPFGGFAYGGRTADELSERHKARLDGMIDEEMQALMATLETGNTKVHPVMRLGPVRKVLADQVEKLRPDLLVIGSHGRPGIANALLGSVAEDVLSAPPCDVLVVQAW